MTTLKAPKIAYRATLRTVEVDEPYMVKLDGVTAGDDDVVTVHDHVTIGDRNVVRSASGDGFWHLAADLAGTTPIPTAVFAPHATASFVFPARQGPADRVMRERAASLSPAARREPPILSEAGHHDRHLWGKGRVGIERMTTVNLSDAIYLLEQSEKYAGALDGWRSSDRHRYYVARTGTRAVGLLGGAVDSDFGSHDTLAAGSIPPAPHAYVSLVLVQKEGRRAGAGTALVSAFVADAARAGCSFVAAMLDTGPELDRRCAFFESMGFVITPDFFAGMPVHIR
ncbi:GNAT family N-acetyltransferase [Nocardioides alkalitolerans]|uniref:GNAT family N-acetyltransferase n=1 Tax=Nocardioides alkalitolerans TaxID=281714 RepID=UPI00048DE47A|nr:GNAT family N-acetyltransferase [Nocardioides alkalitolerans]